MVEHEGADTRGVRLKRGDHQVQHQPHIRLVVCRNPRRWRRQRIALRPVVAHLGRPTLRKLDASFQGADRLEILIEPVAVGSAHIGAQGVRVGENRVHHGTVRGAARGWTEHPVEDRPWLDLAGHRAIGRRPGDGVARQRVREVALTLERELQRRQQCLVAQVIRHNLIDRDAPGVDRP